MKALQRFCAVFVLTFTLGLSAFAGEMTTGVTAPPPPPSITGDMSTGLTGEITTGATATDPVTETFLNLLQSLLALF